ncbi:PIN domain-containing protein [Streptomyces sp. NPDC018693]|uniref:PIN domain-containing protein n=1 Tax=unclassified Streptomyces TaxID=2593676 RepID=UPI00378F6C49
MIILDTSILRSFSPESSSADLLRAIRALEAEQVAVPWMVLEELTAQQAIKYREKYDAAAQAVEALRQVYPLPLEVPLGPCEADEVRIHWRNKWREVVDEVKTSEQVLREAAVREANNLAPCKTAKGFKTGFRDAAIWLSAVEYAREHPDVTVYFVSANTNDFGKGAPYPSPMDEDLAGLEGRFVHLISMDEVADQFTEPATPDEALAVRILTSRNVTEAVFQAAHETLALPLDGSFPCTVSTGLAGENAVVPAVGWSTSKVRFGEIESMQAYRIGDHEWYTAVVRWSLGGAVLADVQGKASTWGGCAWTTSVLFTPSIDEPRLTVLRDDTPRALSDDEFKALEMPISQPTPIEKAVQELARAASLAVTLPGFQGVSRAYEGAILRKTQGRQIRLGDTSAG